MKPKLGPAWRYAPIFAQSITAFVLCRLMASPVAAAFLLVTGVSEDKYLNAMKQAKNGASYTSRNNGARVPKNTTLRTLGWAPTFKQFATNQYCCSSQVCRPPASGFFHPRWKQKTY